MTCNCTPEQLADLKTKLMEARTAYHAWMTGQRATRVTFGPNKGVQYSEAAAADLRRYILDLEDQIARCERRGRRGPLLITM